MAKPVVNPIKWWRTNFGEIAPVGHVLRIHRQTDWLRIHSLPDSKRYPDTSEEMDEILRRNEVLASRLFIASEPIYIFRSIFHNPDDNMQPAQLGYDSKNLFRAGVSPESPQDDDYFIVAAETVSWPFPHFAEIVRNIANEDETMICFVSPASGNILCPYDGGLDSFTTETLSKQLSRDFAIWLSLHPLGL